MPLPLNLVIDRTADGRFRAEIAGHPELAVEAENVPQLLSAVQDSFLPLLEGESLESNPSEVQATPPVPGAASLDETDEPLIRAASNAMPDREKLRKLVARHSVPEAWPKEDEGWDDAS